MYNTYIRDAGFAVVSRKIVERTGNIKWLFREVPVTPQDSGWRVLSDRDTAECLDDAKNLAIVDFNDLCNLEPACIGSTTCRSAPTFNSSSNLTDVDAGSTTRPKKRFPSANPRSGPALTGE